MDTLYAKRWNLLRAATIDPITEQTAKRRFEKGPWFTVVVGEGVGKIDVVPDFVLEVTPHADFVKTMLFYPSGSVRLIYNFTKQGDKLFLGTVVRYEYPDSKHYSLSGSSLIETIHYQPDGIVKRIIDYKSDPLIHATDIAEVDVAPNWESIPQFGEWASLGRVERF